VKLALRSRVSNWIGGGAAKALLALPFLLVLLSLPSAAGAATRGAPLSERSTLALPAPGGPFPDTVIHGHRRLLRDGGPNSRAQTYPVIGGQHVEVYSTYYPDAEVQGVVNVLGGLVHGDEMNSLSVYVATPDEISYICGQDALACYSPAMSEMIVSGVNGSAYGVPRDFTIAHEYGHHIANNRLNAPWDALETGAKRWATYERVCQGTRQGQLFPGDEDAHYWENPGEGFAETNAHLNYPALSVPWGYSSLLRPTLDSMDRLRADITAPLSAPVTATWNGSLWPQRRNPAIHRFATPFDGEVVVQLHGPDASNYDIYALGPKLRLNKHKRQGAHKVKVRRSVIQRSVSSGSSEQLQMTLCGHSSIQVEVRRRSGTGPFSVSVTRP
jgi:hypothetical protein